MAVPGYSLWAGEAVSKSGGGACALDTHFVNPAPNEEASIEELFIEFETRGENSAEEFVAELDSCIDSDALLEADDYLGGYLDLLDLYEDYKKSDAKTFALFLAGPPERKPGRTVRPGQSHPIEIRPRVRQRQRPVVRPGRQFESALMRRSRLSLCLKNATDRLNQCPRPFSGDCIVRFLLEFTACYARHASN